MGSDVVFRGVLKTLRMLPSDANTTLVGLPEDIERWKSRDLRGEKYKTILSNGRLELRSATDRLPANQANPLEIVREFPNSSIMIGLRILQENPDSSFVSLGNTGVVMATALRVLGLLDGIDRPPIGVPFPTLKRKVLLLDGGANADCKPHHLVQFARIGSIYVERVWERSNPKVALLNNGSEEYKGNNVTRRAYTLMKGDPSLNFVGFVEGNHMFDGEVDVLVADGFVGNLVLKTAEGLASAIFQMIRREIRRSPLSSIIAKLFLRTVFKNVIRSVDYAEYGGAPLLGVRGNVVICHGRSDALAVMNAMKQGYQMIATSCHKILGESAKSFISENNGNETEVGSR